MNNFDKYYNEQFRQDIQTFFSEIPAISKHTFDDKSIFTVQYQTLTKDFDYLDFLAYEKKHTSELHCFLQFSLTKYATLTIRCITTNFKT